MNLLSAHKQTYCSLLHFTFQSENVIYIVCSLCHVRWSCSFTVTNHIAIAMRHIWSMLLFLFGLRFACKCTNGFQLARVTCTLCMLKFRWKWMGDHDGGKYFIYIWKWKSIKMHACLEIEKSLLMLEMTVCCCSNSD